MSLENIVNKIEAITKQMVVVVLEISIVCFLITVFAPSNYDLFAVAQQTADKTYHSNATGATITFHGRSITSKTSNVTGTNNPGITGFAAQNSMRNMTNPMFLMKKNPLSNLSNPLANLKNPFAK